MERDGTGASGRGGIERVAEGIEALATAPERVNSNHAGGGARGI